jgi:molybdenum cofactor biosynthesis protein B
MSQAVIEHKTAAPQSLHLAVVTVSDSRTPQTDTSGALIVTLSEETGHHIVGRSIVPDDPPQLSSVLKGYTTREDVHAILVTGGTGISPRDQTFETVSGLLTKVLPGYGELFRMLSFAEIGPACLLSRAIGGLAGKCVILVMPGSRAGVELAMRKIILPELPHLVREARKT